MKKQFSQAEGKEKNTCTPMFTAALFTIANTCKQLKCPSADEWIKIYTYHTYNGILLSHKKKPFATADLEGFMLREISHIER